VEEVEAGHGPELVPRSVPFEADHALVPVVRVARAAVGRRRRRRIAVARGLVHRHEEAAYSRWARATVGLRRGHERRHEKGGHAVDDLHVRLTSLHALDAVHQVEQERGARVPRRQRREHVPQPREQHVPDPVRAELRGPQRA